MKTILKNSFRFSNIFALRKTSSKAFIWYFLIIVIFSSLPLNLLIISGQGWNLNAIVANLEEEDLTWLPRELPINFIVDPNRGLFSVNDDQNKYEFKSSKYTFLINGQEGNYEAHPNLVVLTPDEVIFYNSKLKELRGSYRHLKMKVDFQQLTRMENITESKLMFVDIIESAFAPYFIFYSVLVWTIINLLMQTILLFMVAGIFMLIRINYQKVASYKEYLQIFIASYTVPVLVAVGIGLISESTAPFSPVILQFGTALMAVGAIYIGSKKEINHPHRLKETL